MRPPLFNLKPGQADAVPLAESGVVYPLFFTGRVLWNGKEKTVPALELVGDPLLKAALTHEHQSTVKANFGGTVLAEPFGKEAPCPIF